MPYTNYSDLQASVAAYLARTDLTERIPDFIRFAENRLRRDLRIRQMMTVATAATTGGDSTVSLPADFLELRDLHIQGNPVTTLSYLGPSVFFRNAQTYNSGLPTEYTVMGQEFRFAPIPDGTYTLEMLYYAAPPYLSNTNPSNVFLANAPDLLLYGALAEAEPYLMNDERVQLWAAMYQRSLDSLNNADDRAEHAGVPMAMTVSTR